MGLITDDLGEDRMSVAWGLSDEISRRGITLKKRVQLARKSVKTESGQKSLRELEDLAEETVENLRRITRALRPIYLEDLGLSTALGMLARETGQMEGLDVEFVLLDAKHRLTSEVELSLYRIAQEALNNVVHHAQAKQAVVSLQFT